MTSSTLARIEADKTQHQFACPSIGATESEERDFRRSIAGKSAPMRQVLQTSELLECVLLHLDMQTLLVSAQLACRAWRHLVSTSPALQTALFFRPETNTGAGEVFERGTVRKNPVLAACFPDWFQNNNVSDPSHTAITWVPNLHDMSSQPFARRTEAFMRPEASWYRMLVRQPPVYHLGQWDSTYSCFAAAYSALLRHYPDGLLMGQLYDLTIRFSTGESSAHLIWGGDGTATSRDDAAGAAGASRMAGRGVFSGARPLVPDAAENFLRLARGADLVIALDTYMSCVGWDLANEHIALYRKFLLGDGGSNMSSWSRKGLPRGRETWKWSSTDTAEPCVLNDLDPNFWT